MVDKKKALAARAFVLPLEQIRYYDELDLEQQEAVTRSWGKVPERRWYVYAVKRNGELVWDRFRITELLRQN